MKKRILIPGALVVLLLALCYLTEAKLPVLLDLYTTPRVGSFEVDVTTNGELKAKNSVEIRGPQGARDFE